jgi:hypothetical protein
MQRLYNKAPHVSTNGGFKAVQRANDMLGDAGYDRQRDNGIRGRVAARKNPMGAPRLIPVSQIGGAVERMTGTRGFALPGATQGEAKPTSGFHESHAGHGVAPFIRQRPARVIRDPENLKVPGR